MSAAEQQAAIGNGQNSERAEHLGSGRLYLTTWIGLLLLTVLELVLVNMQPGESVLLPALLTTTFGKVILIAGNFMHLRFERFGVILIMVMAFVMASIMFGLSHIDFLR